MQVCSITMASTLEGVIVRNFTSQNSHRSVHVTLDGVGSLVMRRCCMQCSNRQANRLSESPQSEYKHESPLQPWYVCT